MRCCRSAAIPSLLGLSTLLLLGACADAGPEPSAGTMTARNNAGTRATAPVAAYDGRYSGTMTLNPDRTRRCPEPSAGPREATVTQGRVSFTVNPAIREVLTGTVAADGSARMASNIDRSVATTGIFTEDGFLGEHRNGLCTYNVNLRKIG